MCSISIPNFARPKRCRTAKITSGDMSWKRLPTFFANIPLKLMPLSEGQQKAFETNGTLKQVAFQTVPSVSKVTASHLHSVRVSRRCSLPPKPNPHGLDTS